VAVRVRCFAKLNLFLKIYGKRADGFHDLVSLMQSIDLADKLLLEETGDEGIVISCTNPNIPADSRNLVWRAAEMLAEAAGRPVGGLRITIEKNIPIMGGLGGGSSDGAGALAGLRKLWKLDIEDKQLFEVAARLGSDVPFCLLGGTALVSGRGEFLEPMPTGIAETPRSFGAFLLIIPPLHVSTKAAYELLDENRERAVSKWDEPREEYTVAREGWMAAIATGNLPILFHNDFEQPLFHAMPELEAIHTNLRNFAGHALLSGSGSCIFAWYPMVLDAMTAVDRYPALAGETPLVVFPAGIGIQVESD